MKCQTSTSHPTCSSSSDSISPSATFQRVILNALIVVALSILVNLCLRIDFTLLHHGLGETSVTEISQSVMLAITSLAFFFLAGNNRSLRHAAVLFGGFFTVLFIRESDVWFDLIYHGAWAVPAVFVAIAASYYAYSGGRSTLQQMADIFNSRYMPMLVTAVVVLLVFSRLYGMGSFWHSVMEEHYLRDVKNLSEEAIESLCYSLIAFCAIKTHLQLSRRNVLDQNGD